MIINERNTRRERLMQAANAMMTAARTAPKGKGYDIIEIAIITDETIVELSNAMFEYSQQSGLKFITRDAENILKSEVILLIGTRQQNQNLNCGYCGFDTCAEKNSQPDIPCALNTVDVGIAIGSACAVAADLKVDTRVMFSVGRVAKEIGLLPGCSSIFGIPLSCSSKNPFFDRVSKTPAPK